MTVNLGDPKVNTFATQLISAFNFEIGRFKGNQPMANILSAYKDFTDQKDSQKKSNKYFWNGPVPELKKLLGGIPLSDLSRHFYLVKNEDWGAGVVYKSGDIKDGFVEDPKETATKMASQAFYWPGTIIQDLLFNGTTETCWDDSFFFNNAHPTESGATFDNLLAVGALSKTSLAAAMAAMLRFPTDSGKGAGIMPTHLVVPVELWETALELCHNTMTPLVNSFTENVFKGMLIPVFDPGLTDVNDWYLVRGLKGSVQPFIFQLREKPRIEFDKKDETLESLIYLVQKSRGVGAYGDPRTAVKNVV